jgi:hypothetical protein
LLIGIEFNNQQHSIKSVGLRMWGGRQLMNAPAATSAGLSPQQLPALVEHTPMLAYELLLRLLRSRHINAYFQVRQQVAKD